jgi:hypothetical protein
MVDFLLDKPVLHLQALLITPQFVDGAVFHHFWKVCMRKDLLHLLNLFALSLLLGFGLGFLGFFH